jgi:hypothetical protein
MKISHKEFIYQYDIKIEKNKFLARYQIYHISLYNQYFNKHSAYCGGYIFMLMSCSVLRGNNIVLKFQLSPNICYHWGDNIFLSFCCELHLHLGFKEQTRKLVLLSFVLDRIFVINDGIGNQLLRASADYFMKKEI